MRRILTISFVILMLCCLLLTSAFADTTPSQCGRQKVNIIGSSTIEARTEDENVSEYLASLKDGSKDTGIKSSEKETKFPIIIRFEGNGVMLEEVVVTIISATSSGVASGTTGLANKPFGASLKFYAHPTDKSEAKVFEITPGAAQKEVVFDLSDFQKLIETVEIEVTCNQEGNHPIWEIEANQYQGEHDWRLVSTIQEETCQEKGRGNYSCSCGATKEDDIPKKQHDLKWIYDEETHYQDCLTCDEIFNEGNHNYDHDCDIDCNDCKKPRVVAGHSYRSDCATVCEKCAGAKRTPIKSTHTYKSDCDEYCDDCFEKRTTTVEHIYDNACDDTCDPCQGKREVPPHQYTGEIDCDEFCDVCGKKRTTTIGHIYTNNAECDDTCNTCGTKRETTKDHNYPNRCTATCRDCRYTRTAETDSTFLPNHLYDTPCDTECNSCQATRTAAHTYSFECDRVCNNCSFERPARHVYPVKGTVILPASEKNVGYELFSCVYECGEGDKTVQIPKLPKKDNTPLIIAAVASAVVILACTGIALYSLVFKKRADEKKRKVQEYIKAQEAAKKAQEAEEEEENDYTENTPAFGGSMYDDSDSEPATSSFSGIGIGIGYQDESAQTDGDDEEDENSDTSDDETEE